MNRRMNGQWLRSVRLAVALAAIWLSFLPTAFAYELAEGWRAQVLVRGLPQVDNLALDAQGRLYATLEKYDGAGRLIRLDTHGITVLLDKLNKPDGLAISGNQLLLTEEITNGRIIRYDLSDGSHTVLARLDHAEGVVSLPDGSWILSEDQRRGRLVRLLPNGKIQPLADGLRRPEGLALGPDGTLYIAETLTGRVLSLRRNTLQVVVRGVVQPDQLAIDRQGRLWISEDSHKGRLLRLDKEGLVTIVSELDAPQGIVFMGDRVLVAEQNAGRILMLIPPGDTADTPMEEHLTGGGATAPAGRKITP